MNELRADARRNREAVIEGAVRVLAERPTASIGEIAAASKVGRTTVYRHFPTRDDLIFALLERVVQEARAIVVEILAGDPPADAVLRDLAAEILALGVRYRFLSAHRDDRALREHEERADELGVYLLRAQERGQLRADLPVEWMLTCFRALSIATLDEVSDGRLEIDRAGRLLGDALVASFGATGAG
jgi:AcrR family transcriptional regulator